MIEILGGRIQWKPSAKELEGARFQETLIAESGNKLFRA
jgi:hypothetical protein